jgi:hypothetical protein
VKVLRCNGLDRGEFVDAGIVNEDVDTPEGSLGVGKQADDVAGVGDIALQGDRLAAGGGDVGDDLVGSGLAGGVVDNDGRTGRGEVLGNGGADALGGAGDEGGLPASLCDFMMIGGKARWTEE